MISIITPVFNGESHIEECITKVVNQKCNNIEHIIVDGQSEDNTLYIIKKHAREFAHIRWISEKDKGQSDAMNKGLTIAKGEIIGILNADDYYEPHVLNKIVHLFNSLRKPALVVGNCNVWNDKGALLYVNKPRNMKLYDLLKGWQINPHPVNPSAYFYHKSVHDIIGPYDENEHYAMDLDFILKAVTVAEVIYFDEIWGNFLFCSGTKTSIDKAKGTASARAEKLFKFHRSKLAFWRQVWLLPSIRIHQLKKRIFRFKRIFE